MFDDPDRAMPEAEWNEIRTELAAQLTRLRPSRANAPSTRAPASPNDGRLQIRSVGDLSTLPPPRGWLLGTMLCRGYVTMLAAGGGTGKTALCVRQALALATGRDLTDEKVHHRSKVFYLSLEDGGGELERRLHAAMLETGIRPADVGDWLLYDAPLGDAGHLLVRNPAGEPEEGPLAGKLASAISKHGVDVVFIDPLVKAHGLAENDNGEMDRLMTLCTGLAAQYGIAFCLVHHTSKAGSAAEPGNANSARGASAIKDAARITRTLTKMSPKEATDLGIPEERRHRWVRMDDGKVNLAPVLTAQWFEIVGVGLGNGNTDYPQGDNVHTVVPRRPPKAAIDDETRARILADLDAGVPDGDRYSLGNKATHKAFEVVKRHVPDASDARCKDFIKTLLREGAIREVDYTNSNRKKRKGVFVNVMSGDDDD